ncbi:hypothetical protein BS50DRAFT_650710 [Corynespora cassiicola Philippines]|uniref:DUF7730 domain-containing protein n=1 Tax=Corynespora cassiicola Philippines TaxID=1448308 RepID=A0A2T2N9S1_CORCC|nr:hypothetical protein BS50DRAFT_650710 [Corynespora cassiicola Philippines]
MDRMASKNAATAAKLILDIQKVQYEPSEEVQAILSKMKCFLQGVLSQEGVVLDPAPSAIPKDINATCSFLRHLCYDVRYLLYENLLKYDQTINLAKSGVDRQTLGELRPFPGLRYQLSPLILLTCKEIYREALPVLYGGNEFGFHVIRNAHAWLRQIGYKGMNELRHLKLDTNLMSNGIHRINLSSMSYHIPFALTLNGSRTFRPCQESFRMLSQFAGCLRQLTISFGKTAPDGYPLFSWVDKRNPLHALSWTYQIRAIKQLTNIRSLEVICFDGVYPAPLPGYLKKKMGVSIHFVGQASPFQWHLADLQQRFHRDLAVLNMPPEEAKKLIQTSSYFQNVFDNSLSDKSMAKNLADEKHGFFYTCYEDVKEAIEFQDELDELLVRDHGDA